MDIESPNGGAAQQGGTKRRLRIYEQWQGNEKFFLYGFLVAGPNWKASIGTALLIAAPAGIYLAFVAPYMGLHVHIVILVISCILPVLSIWFLMLTACRDPGIIPRQEPDQEYLSGQKPRTKDVYVNNQRVVIRYNDTCHFYQPPRAHHCSVNDNCIERFDHHCPWVGTTIGLRNYRTFLLFVYTSAVLCMYVFGVSLAMLFVKHNQLVDEAREAGRDTGGLWGKTLGQCAPALALMGYTFLFFWFVGGLSAFHAYLVGTNQTTYENFRYNHDNRPNPYSRGLLRNCAEVWCMPVPPSRVKFRAHVDEFRPPTGQPYSPYLANQPQQDDAGTSGDQVDHQQSSEDMGQQGSVQHQHQQHSQLYQQQQQIGYGAGHGAPLSVGGPSSPGAGFQPLSQASGGGYDPAALQPHPGQYNIQYGGPGPQQQYQQYNTQGQGQQVLDVHVGPEPESRGYSDAGAGWGAGGGPGNQPPAAVRGTDQAPFTARRNSATGPAGAGPVQQVQYGGPADVQYYNGNGGYDDGYDDGDGDNGYDGEDGQFPVEQYGHGVVGPEQVRAALPR